jgi:ATP-dependent helicase Lhr and Lhr-like helicase
MGLVVLPLHEISGPMLDELVRSGRARSIDTPAGLLVLATENLPRMVALYGDDNSDAHGDAVHAALRGYAEIAGPFVEASFAARIGVPSSSVAIAGARLEAEGFVLRGRFTPRSVAGGEGELCDRRLLARIHRLTLDRLRSEIEPVSAQDLMRFLLERHHLTQSARAAGRAGLRDAIGMLQGFEIAASAWESDILPARVAGYRSEWLDELCLSGEVAWARLSPRQTAQYTLASPSKATPIALTMRAELDWLLAAARGDVALEAPALEAAKQTLALLERRGALFFNDLVTRTKLPAVEVKDAMWDLIGRGHATSDGFQPLRDLLAHGRSKVPAGRFALLERTDGEPLDAETLADRVAGQWLARYGVVFRDLVARESSAVPWRDVARALRRREAKGLLRGGRFVSGFIGEQFALPEAVDALRRIRKSPRNGETVRVAAVDPLNLVGIILPGSRVPAHTGAWITYRDGVVVEGSFEVAS